MKTLKYMAAVFAATIILAIPTFAAEGDYGYYDRNYDGKISTVDVLEIVKDVLNHTDSDNTLMKALRALKISVSGETVTAILKSMDYTNKTATVFYKDNEVAMSFAQLGLDKVKFADLYEEGLVTITVPSPAKDFFASFDAKSVYAAKVNYRYDTTVLNATVGSEKADVDGEEVVLANAPTVIDGEVMVDASVFNAYFETEIQENGYVSAKDTAERIGMKFDFNEDSGKLILIKQFYPMLILNSATCAAGGEVAVNVTVKHNPGFAGLEYRINYDSDVMSYVSGKANTSSFFSQFSPAAGANPVKAVLANLSLKNISGDLSLATITFKTAENVAAGEYSLTLSDFKCYDADIINIKMIAVNNTITVE